MYGLLTGRIYLPPPDDTPGPHFCYRLSGTKGIVRPEGLSQWKTIQMTPSGIEKAKSRPVAQSLNEPYSRYSDSLRALQSGGRECTRADRLCGAPSLL